ncbi:hypothetical protein ACHQM5_011107 [Ranunculus cassubicifolius]
MVSEDGSIEHKLMDPINLADQVHKLATLAESFKPECSEVISRVDRLSQMLRSIVRLAASSSSTSTPVYERPVHRIVDEVIKNLERTLVLIKKCKRTGMLRRVIGIISATDFRKVHSLLDTSIGDMKWLMSVFESSTDVNGGGGMNPTLPPIATTDPILSWVWSYIATIQMSSSLPDRTDAARGLASLAGEANPRNKKIIVEEGAIPPLLKLLKEASSPDAQVASAEALSHLCGEQESVRLILAEGGVPTIVQVLWDSPMLVQIAVAELVARMAQRDSSAQEVFAIENAIRPLVSLLSLETMLDDPKPPSHGGKVQPGKPIASLQSLVQFNKDSGGNMHLYPKNSQHRYRHLSSGSSDGSVRGVNYKIERENEKPEVKLMLKEKCAEALWFLSIGSVANSQRITDTKGFLCLARHVEKEKGDLQFYCLRTLTEIAAAAESSGDLRRAAFKTNSSAAKTVIDQLLRVIQEIENANLQIPAIKAVGSLARTFQASETRVIGPLVTKLGHWNRTVVTEAILALEKFASPENFLCVKHSKAIIEAGGVSNLLALQSIPGDAHSDGLILLSYLAMHVGNNEALTRSKALSVLRGAAARYPVSHDPLLREVIPKAIYQLEIYQEGSHPHMQTHGLPLPR